MLSPKTPGGNLGFFGGQKYKRLGNLPNGTTFGTCLLIHLGMDIG